MSERLDMLLSRPLSEIADNGFSHRVRAEIALQQLRRARLNTEIAVGLVVLAMLVLPFTAPGRMLAASAMTGIGMILITLAFGLVLTLFTYRSAGR